MQLTMSPYGCEDLFLYEGEDL